jgi:hypothetical protein
MNKFPNGLVPLANTVPYTNQNRSWHLELRWSDSKHWANLLNLLCLQLKAKSLMFDTSKNTAIQASLIHINPNLILVTVCW